jgi:hypothetical protein
MWTVIVMVEHYTGCHHYAPFFLNGRMQFFSVSQYNSDVIVPSALLSCPRKQLPSAFWQADYVRSNFFGLFGECVCIHCFDRSLVSTIINESQV